MGKTNDEASYGVDAPAVVRNLSLAALAALLLAAAAALRILPRDLVAHPTSTLAVHFPLASMGLWAGLGFAFGAGWMYFGSRLGKTRERERLLDRIEWRGDERVLDVGCGRGLLLVGAARRLRSGSAVGVDIWQAEDLSGNRPEAPLRNAEIEGVADRVSVETADMRRLPFPDASFDVVLSRAAIHNLRSESDRRAAIREIARVLKPGGRAVISDIRNHEAYRRTFAENGCPDVRLVESRAISALCAVATLGAVRPNTMLVRKAAQ